MPPECPGGAQSLCNEARIPGSVARGSTTLDARTAWAAPGVRIRRPAHDTGPVGLNPFRQHRRSPADVFMVAGALLVCVALVAWALLG
jgi:hypothetical protein